MTHLFAADVLQRDYADLPVNWNLWHSDMASAFNKMVEDVLSKLTIRTAVRPPTLPFSAPSLPAMAV